MPVCTLRAWVLGIIWAVLIPGLNQFLFFRFPSIQVSGVSTFIVCPSSRPSSQYVTDCCPTLVIPSRPSMGVSFSQCQDIWGLSESGAVHDQRTCVDHSNGHRWVSVRVRGRSSFCLEHNCLFTHRHYLKTDIIAVQRVYYNQVYNFSYQWMVVMSTQLVCLDQPC